MDALHAYAADLASILDSSFGEELDDISLETVRVNPQNSLGFPVINAAVAPKVSASWERNGLQLFLTQFAVQHGFECAFDYSADPTSVQFYPSPNIDFPLQSRA
jgi:hypothetical protein